MWSILYQVSLISEDKDPFVMFIKACTTFECKWPFLSSWEQIKVELTGVRVDDNNESCVR